jgi:hypothetical protein
LFDYNVCRDNLNGSSIRDGALMTPRTHRRDHGHDAQAVPSDPALRVKALESLLVAKGLVDRGAVDALIDTYEHKVGRYGCITPSITLGAAVTVGLTPM